MCAIASNTRVCANYFHGQSETFQIIIFNFIHIFREWFTAFFHQSSIITTRRQLSQKQKKNKNIINTRNEKLFITHKCITFTTFCVSKNECTVTNRERKRLISLSSCELELKCTNTNTHLQFLYLILIGVWKQQHKHQWMGFGSSFSNICAWCRGGSLFTHSEKTKKKRIELMTWWLLTFGGTEADHVAFPRIWMECCNYNWRTMCVSMWFFFVDEVCLSDESSKIFQKEAFFFLSFPPLIDGDEMLLLNILFLLKQ